MLLARDDSLLAAAAHLVRGARQGDSATVDVLCQAAEEAVERSPRTAAELAMRGLELITPQHECHLPLTTVAIEAYTRSGPLGTAIELAKKALAASQPSVESARLRCWLSEALLLHGNAAEAIAEAEHVLASAMAPDSVHDDALRTRMWASFAQDEAVARKHAEQLLRRNPANGTLRGNALSVLAVTHWRAGRIGKALDLSREAMSLLGPSLASTYSTHAGFTLVVMLTHLGELDEAEALLDAVPVDINLTLVGISRIVRGQLMARQGRMQDAAAEAMAGIAAAEEAGTPIYTAIGWALLAAVALRQGDLKAAAEHIASLQATMSHDPVRAQTVMGAWMRAQLAEAQRDQDDLLRALEDIWASEDRYRELLVNQPHSAAWIVRTAQRCERRAEAQRTADVVTQLARDNPGIPTLVAAAAHVRGLVFHDVDEIRRAADGYREIWPRASAEEDLATLMVNVDQDAAISLFDEAIGHYRLAGAEWDAARIRHKLRKLGVRRRHWTYTDRPATGWDSLTSTEQAVSELVLQGLTNRQIATQMFLSPHTVAFHLRKIFRKLGVHSRVELAQHARHGPPLA